MLYSISLIDSAAEPRPIATCWSSFPALSPDGQQVAYVEGESLRIRDLASQTSVAEWKGPFIWWGGAAWSPKGDELCLGGNSSTEKRAGLWICRFGSGEPVKILDGQVEVGSWSPDGTKLVFTLGAPFFGVWTADVDPNVSLIESLGPTQTLDEHFQELAALWTRRIATDPADANNYLHRAECYRSLHEETKLRADARRYWVALHPGLPPGFRFGGPWSILHTINGPFDYQLVLFLERQEDGMMLLRTGFGPKGRCGMNVLEIPMVGTSLLGLCFLAGLDTPAMPADFTLGERVNLGPTVNSLQADSFPVISRDGLELYFASARPEGFGDWDIWRSQRAKVEDPWGPPVNLGPGINGPSFDCITGLTSDGLTLHLFALTGAGGELYTATRPTKDAPWGPRVNLGPVVNRSGGVGLGNDISGTLSPDDLELFFASDRPGTLGNWDIYVTTRANRSDAWRPPVNLGPAVNTSRVEFPLGVSPDGLVLFLVADRPGGWGGFDTWMARRPCKGAAWSEPVNLGPSFNTSNGDVFGSVSPDGQWCYFGEWNGAPPGPSSDLWMAPIIPPLISTQMENEP